VTIRATNNVATSSAATTSVRVVAVRAKVSRKLRGKRTIGFNPPSSTAQRCYGMLARLGAGMSAMVWLERSQSRLWELSLAAAIRGGGLVACGFSIQPGSHDPGRGPARGLWLTR
jgi:hypothetical protein